MVGVWLSWGLGYPFMAWSLRAVDMFTSRLIVMPVAGLTLLAVAALRPGGRLLPAAGSWGWLAVTGLFNMSLFQIFLLSGVVLIGPSRTPIVIYTMPAWSALLGALFLGERLTGRIKLALALGLAAVGVMVAQEMDKVSAAPVGGLLTLLGAIAFAIGTVLMKAWGSRQDLALVAGWQLILGTVPMAAVWLVARDHTYFHAGDALGLFGLAASAFVSNVVAYLCWFPMVRALPVALAGLSTLIVPCVGVASSVLFLGSVMSWLDAAGLALMLASVSLVLVERVRGG